MKSKERNNLAPNRRAIDVTVIVPMYNVENLIAETIESIKQNDCNLEILLINDGSTDNTLEKAKEAVGSDPRFVFINQENQGVSVARNKGLSLARGNYITFVDSDDLLSEYALDKMFYAAQEKESDFVYGATKKFNTENSWYLHAHIRHNIFRAGYKNIVDNPEVVFFIGVAGKLIHHSILDGQQFPTGIKFSEDTVVIFCSFVKASNIYTIPDVVYYYRERDITIGEASATQKLKTEAFAYLNDLFKTIIICRNNAYKNENLTKRERVKFLSKYYDRIFAYEVWPLLLNCLRHDNENNTQVFVAFLSFLKEHTSDEINQFPAIRLYLIKVLVNYSFLIKNKSFYAYRELLEYLFSILSPEIQNLCSREDYYGKKWADSIYITTANKFLARLFFMKLKEVKRFNWNIKNNPVFVKRYFFNFFRMLPIKKNKIVFATGNPKPMRQNFDYVLNEIKKRQSAENYSVYKFLGNTESVKTLLYRYYHLATANVIFLEDYYKPIYGYRFSKKTKIIQLWHACGAFKKFSHDAIGQSESNTLELESKAHNMYTDVIVSSEKISQHYSSAFNISINNIKDYGIPRTDIFFRYKTMADAKIKILKKRPFLASTKNILYAPTFRGGPSERKIFNLPINWGELKNLPVDYRFIIKLHPAVEEIKPAIPEWVKDKVILLSSKEDINKWMLLCDVLVTDYSSLIFEYSLLNKPIVYFPFDLDNYFDERGFYYPYETYVYGDVVYTTKDLVDAVQMAEIQMPLFKENKLDFRNRFMSNCDGHATSRIVDAFIGKS